MAEAIGVLGGGQLGLMLAEAIDHLGWDTHFLEPDPDAPCARRRSNVLSRPMDDALALEELFSRVEVATFDSENIPSAPLAPFAAKLSPSLHVLKVTQHRAEEKAFLAAGGFGPVAHLAVPVGGDVVAAVKSFGVPCIAKSTLGGYDGKGQHRLSSVEDAARLPAGGGWVLEEVLVLEAEVSCIVARDRGQAFTFPVFENTHVHHVLDTTVLPAGVPAAVADEAKGRALAIAAALDVRGLLTVEFFLGKGRDGVSRLYVNELAPRVHNSGHVTRAACTVSQFDALAHILSGVPVPPPVLHSGGWCMGQLLGDVWHAQGRGGGPLDLEAWKDFPDVVEVYVYGKRQARQGRKMGHFIVRGPDAPTARRRALEFRAALERRVD